jgi:hypothetical protein
MAAGNENRLPRVGAGAAVVVGAFLLLGAHGHVDAVLPAVRDGTGESLWLLLPGLILGMAGAANIALCKLVWDASPSGLTAALAVNSLTLLYLAWLLWTGVVPDHPIALFTGVVASHAVLLAANRFGLVWPAEVSAR